MLLTFLTMACLFDVTVTYVEHALPMPVLSLQGSMLLTGWTKGGALALLLIVHACRQIGWC